MQSYPSVETTSFTTHFSWYSELKPTKEHEDKKSVVHTIQYHRITHYLRRVDIQISCLNHEHGDGLFETHSVPSRIQLASTGTKP